MRKIKDIVQRILIASGFQSYTFAVLFLLAFTLRILPGPRTIDDAFITFRYARNILAGNGFVYNPGEHILGTTTPLYTILLTLLSLPFGGVDAPFPWIAMVVNAIADGFSCILLFRLGARLKYPLAGMATAIVWAIAPYSVTFAIGGLETSVYVVLLLSTVHSWISQRRIQAALTGALALLTRPDALLLLLPLMLDRILTTLVERKSSRLDPQNGERINNSGWTKSLWIEGLTFSLPLLVWVAFSTLYFGSPLPHSITAKAMAYRLPPEAALVRLMQHYATPFLEHLTFGTPWIAVGLVLYPFLFIAGALQILRSNRHTWTLVAYPWLYFFAFAIANPLIFRWYLTPPLPFYFFVILVGMTNVIEKLLSGLARRITPSGEPSKLRAVFLLGSAFVLLAPVSLSLQGWTIKPDHGLTRPAPEMAWYQLELLYRQAAEELAEEIAIRPSPATLAAGDVGVLGYYTHARILDTVGLNSPQSLQYYPLDPIYYAINYAIPPRLILDHRPDYLVILEVYGRNGLLKDAQFLAAYRLRKKIPTDIYGSDGMLIYERNTPSTGLSQ